VRVCFYHVGPQGAVVKGGIHLFALKVVVGSLPGREITGPLERNFALSRLTHEFGIWEDRLKGNHGMKGARTL